MNLSAAAAHPSILHCGAVKPLGCAGGTCVDLMGGRGMNTAACCRTASNLLGFNGFSVPSLLVLWFVVSACC